ncbi:glycosyltransferase family 2 protein [Vagococcus entomophilus]|nr:glycosyltransferase family 2 protein [Vagococcus entomophilus]
MGKLSIIIPCYNVSSTIEKCLSSLLLLNKQDLELICIDDGSKDDTLDILKKYEKLDNRIIVLCQENAGQAVARNQGLNVATGKFITFVDSDDYIDHHLYNAMLKNINQSPDFDMLIFGYEILSKDGQSLEVRVDKKLGDCQDFVMKFLEDEGDFIGGYSWNKMFKKAILAENCFFDMKFEDIPFVFNQIMSSNKITYYPVPIYKYIQHPNSTVRTFNRKNLLDRIKALVMVNEVVKSNKKYDALLIKYNLLYLLKAYRLNQLCLGDQEVDKEINDRMPRKQVLTNPLITTRLKIKYLLYKFNLLKYAIRVNNRVKE